MLTKNELKDKMYNAGFDCNYSPEHNWHENWEYCKKDGRPFRVRYEYDAVDIGEVYGIFDRWANSTERTLTISEFVKEYLK